MKALRAAVMVALIPGWTLAGPNRWTLANAQTSGAFVRTVGLAGTVVSDVAVCASDSAVAYAATSEGIFKTTNRGQSWALTREGRFDVVASSSTDARTAYASDENTYQMVRTTDGGASWTTIKTDFASVMAVVPSNPSALYAALNGPGMSKSSDGGTTWSLIMNGLPHDFFYIFYGWYADSVAVDPTNSSTVYVGKTQGMFKTTDGGNNWNQISEMKDPLSIAIDPNNPSVIYFGAYIGGVLRSNNGGITWSDAGLTDKRVKSLAISTTSPAILYAGTQDGFVYRSSNGAADWSVLDSGLSVSHLSVDASGNFLYVATGGGVVQYSIFNDNVSIEALPGDPQRLPRLLGQLIGVTDGFVIPVAGKATGLGSLFTTEVMLTNKLDRQQDVVLAWMPRAPGGGVSMFRMTLPASSQNGTVNIADIADRLGFSGVGSLAVFATTSDGNVDSSASIDGSAHIWMYPADGRPPMTQVIPAVHSALFSNHVRAQATDLQQDAAFRTNVGIVNLSAGVHQYTIQINGELRSGQFTIAVPPFSLAQVPISTTDYYGKLNLVVLADAASAWCLYGSTINNSTEDAHTSIGVPGDS